jgi:hypothetical protein
VVKYLFGPYLCPLALLLPLEAVTLLRLPSNLAFPSPMIVFSLILLIGSANDMGTSAVHPIIFLLSVFDDRQLIMGSPGTMIDGLRRMQNSTINSETTFILVHATE